MVKLFEPLRIREVTLKNRIVVSPMCQYSSQDGFANDWHLVHLGSRAVGGASLIIAEATAVSAEGRITPHDLGIYKEEHLEMLSRITAFIKSQDCIPGIQLAHAGRKASHHRPWDGGDALTEAEGAWQTIAPSAIPYRQGEPVPKEVTIADIRQTIKDFQTGARRALEAGFQLIEIHGAHGYLINEFLSPLSNTRQDEYGGSFENRTRFLMEIIESIREVWPERYPLFLRISATDWAEGGWTGDDSVHLAEVLKKQGAVDLIDCSTGANVSGVRIPITHGYQVPFAERIKKETGMLTGAVGLITTSAQAEKILEDGQADVIIMARQMLREPYFALHAAHDMGVDISWPPQYERAQKY